MTRMWTTPIRLTAAPARISVRGVSARDAQTVAPAPAVTLPAATPSTSATTPPSLPSPIATQPPSIPADSPEVLRMLQSLSQSIDELEVRRRRSLNELQQAAVELGLAIASQLTYHVIEAGEFAVEQLVQDAVSRLPAARPVKVWLHPEDLALLRRRVAERQLDGFEADRIELRGDVTLARGACRAELPEETILSDLHLALGDLHEELMEGLTDAQIERRRTQAADCSLRRFPDRRETA